MAVGCVYGERFCINMMLISAFIHQPFDLHYMCCTANMWQKYIVFCFTAAPQVFVLFALGCRWSEGLQNCILIED